MLCNGKFCNFSNILLILAITTMCKLSAIVGLLQAPMIYHNPWPITEGTNGDLYEIFKERLQKIQKELTNDCQEQTETIRGDKESHPGYIGESKKLVDTNKVMQNEAEKRIDNLSANMDFHYGAGEPYSYLQYMPSNVNIFRSAIRRRQAVIKPPNINGNASLYPTILTKALTISLNPSSNMSTSPNSWDNLAREMNTSGIDLAEKLTKSSEYPGPTTNLQDGRKLKIDENFTTTTEPNSFNHKTPIPSSHNMLSHASPDNNNDNTISTSNIKDVLDRVLYKLEQIYKAKNDDDEKHPEGTPCDLVGTWSSTTLGLCFEIQLRPNQGQDISPVEINNKKLSIEAKDCKPPKHHQTIVDLNWTFEGSTLKQIGGPLNLYAQMGSEQLVATFLGFCRTCGGIDTIYGSWSFLSPSKDCEDIPMAFDFKRDMLRRDRMETKRRQRFKDVLYRSRLGKQDDLAQFQPI